MMLEIKTINGRVLYSCEDLSVKECLELAVKDETDLRGADLRGADLRGAYLTGAYLRGAYLTGAYLTGAYLRGAYLRGAYLTGAYLRGAYLRGADLTGAGLRGAYLRGADLRGADLTGAGLRGAYLSGAVLRGAYLSGADGEKILIEKQPLQLDTADYYVTIYDNHMSIGCEFHSIEDWFSFNNKQILAMDGRRSMSFWKTWKKPLERVCLAGGRKV